MQSSSNGISVVITVKNEGRHLKQLFESFLNQVGPFEIVLVDSGSTDNTQDIVESFREELDINHIVEKCSRGEGRNIGTANSRNSWVVFVDGDVTVAPAFLSSYRALFMDGYEVIAGKVVPVGVEKFKLGRVKLFIDAFEITHPSANLGYVKDKFNEIGGFDPSFVTAEDIDLNLRAVMAGARTTQCEDCIVYNRTRTDYGSFMRQAFWNGYGRRQLKRKNLRIWNRIEKGSRSGEAAFFPGTIRLAFGALGYLYAMIGHA